MFPELPNASLNDNMHTKTIFIKDIKYEIDVSLLSDPAIWTGRFLRLNLN